MAAVVSPVEPPRLPTVGGTPALSRVQRGVQRKQSESQRRREREQAEKDPKDGDSKRKGRHIDERA